MNKVMLMGRLTRDPDVRYSTGENSMAVARYTLAVDRVRLRDVFCSPAKHVISICISTETEFNYINYVCETVDPYGLDQQLKDIVQEWRDSF